MSKTYIVLATFNPNKEYFIQQINSLKAQTVTDWKCLITDDNSEIDFLNMIQATISSDPRFFLIKNKSNAGSVFNFENGLKNIPLTAEHIYFCDQDDIWEKQKLEKTLPFFQDPQVMLVHHDLSVINSEGALLSRSCWQLENRDTHALSVANLIFRNSITGCASVFRRQLLDSAVPFFHQERPYFYHHDQWIALQAAEHGKIIALTDCLVRYRQHANNVIGAVSIKKKSIVQKVIDIMQIIKRSEFSFSCRYFLAKNFIQRYPNSLSKKSVATSLGSYLGLCLYLFPRMTKSSLWLKVGIQILVGYWFVKKRDLNEQ